MLRPAFLLAALLGLAVAGLAACATPVAPSGGPPDTDPPVLVSSLPAQGATRVTAQEVVLTFSERLDAATAARAVRVTPEPEAPPRISVRGSDLVISLPGLRDSTTVVVTVGTELTDARRVALRAPITVAFATGDRIDRGRIEGTVRTPATGAAAPGLSVFAYALADTTALPDVASAAPDYRAEATADGAFRLDFLRPGPYFVVAVADRNRNGRVDAAERAAVPPRRAVLATEARPDSAQADVAQADSVQADSVRADPARAPRPAAPALTLWVARRDTLAVRSVRALSDRRFLVRFSQGVVLASGSPVWASVVDSSGAVLEEVELYAVPGEPAEVLAWAARPVRPGPARFAARNVLDSAGVARRPVSSVFDVPARADTFRTRFVRFEPQPAPGDSVARLPPGTPTDPTRADPLLSGRNTPRFGARLPRVILSGPSDVPVTIEMGTNPDGPFERAPGSGTVIPLELCGGRPGICSAPAAPRFVRVVTPDTTATVAFGVYEASELGSIVGRVSPASLYVEATSEAGATALGGVDETGAFVITDLLPGPYRLRIWDDVDRNALWSAGNLAPYIPPDPLRFVEEPAAVRARWETDVGTLTLFETP